LNFFFVHLKISIAVCINGWKENNLAWYTVATGVMHLKILVSCIRNQVFSFHADWL